MTILKLSLDKKLIISLLLLLVLPLLLLWRVTLNGDILLSADMLLLYEPWRSELPGAKAFPIWNEKTADPLRDIYSVALYIKDTWRQGQIPFWYPYVGLGLPILARALNQVMYPINNLLWQMMDVPESFGWSAILHLFLASCFTFFYSREIKVGYFGSLVAAIAFTYSSTLMTWLGLPFIFDSMIWLPLIFLGFERAMARNDWRWTLLGVVGLSLQILAGSLQLVSYGLISLGLYALIRCLVIWRQEGWRRSLQPLGYVVLIVGLGIGLVAFQVLATMELVMAGITRTDVTVNLTLPLRNLARLLIPDIWGTPLDGNDLSSLEFESYLYLGLLPLFFIIAALFSKKSLVARILFGIGLLFLLVIYNVPPFYQLFYYLYPSFSSLGFHRSLYALLFLWAATAGIGADYLVNHRPQQLTRILLGGGGVVGLIALGLAVRLAFIAKYQARYFWPIPDLPAAQPNLLYYFSALVIFLPFWGIACGLLWWWTTERITKQVFIGATLLLLIADLFLTHLDFTPALPKHMLNVSPPSLTLLQELIRQNKEPVRVSGVGNMLRPDTGGVYHIPSVQIHDSYLSQRLSDYADLSNLRSGGTFRDVIFSSATNPLLDALNVKYIYASRQDLTQGDWFSVMENLGQPQVISDHSEAGQVKHWNINNWTQPVLYAPTDTVLNYQSVLPYPALLETAIALEPDTPEGNIIFELYATRPGQEADSPLFTYQLEPSGERGGDGWVPIQVDLSAFAQESVIISLVTRSDNGELVAGGWADPMITDASKYKPVYYGVNSIYENKNYLPRAWIVHTVASVADQPEAQAKLADPAFDPTTEAVIEGLLPEAVYSAGVDRLQFIDYTIAHSTMEVELETPGLLILSDLYYPGWSAQVDGESQPIYPTNLTMQGVWLSAGKHSVEFVYKPLVFIIGLYISSTTILIILLLLWFDWRRRSQEV